MIYSLNIGSHKDRLQPVAAFDPAKFYQELQTEHNPLVLQPVVSTTFEGVLWFGINGQLQM